MPDLKGDLTDIVRCHCCGQFKSFGPAHPLSAPSPVAGLFSPDQYDELHRQWQEAIRRRTEVLAKAASDHTARALPENA